MEPAESSPALAPPPGVVPNFADPPSLRPVQLALTALLITVMIPLHALRVFVKLRLVKRWNLDDTLATLAETMLLVWVSIAAHDRFARLSSRDQWNLQVQDAEYVAYYDFILEIIYCPTMMLAKLSVICQIEKLFARRTHRGAFFYIVWTVIVLTILYYVAATFMFAFQCSPVDKSWQYSVTGKCADIYLLEVVKATGNVISDFATVALPIWSTFRLNLQTNRTIELLAVFSCGFAACALGLFGLIYRARVYENPNVTRSMFVVGVICIAEVAMVLMVGFIPSVSPLFHRNRWRNRSTSPDTSSDIHKLERYQTESNHMMESSVVTESSEPKISTFQPRGLTYPEEVYLPHLGVCALVENRNAPGSDSSSSRSYHVSRESMGWS